MSTITAILEAHPDGSLHLPLPEDLRHTKIKVTATLEPVSTSAPRPRFGSLGGKIWMAPDFNAPLDDFKEYME
jgi:hypothetical protein